MQHNDTEKVNERYKKFSATFIKVLDNFAPMMEYRQKSKNYYFYNNGTSKIPSKYSTIKDTVNLL